MKVRSHDSWIDGIHADTFWRKLQRRASCELVNGSLTDAVRKNVRKCAKPRHTGNVHNIPFSLDNRRQEELCQLKYRANVDVHHDVVIGKRSVFDGSAR